MAFSNPIIAGDTLIREAIQSENFVAGVSGWRIQRDGTAEFNDITARGDISASSLRVVGPDVGATPNATISVESSPFNAIRWSHPLDPDFNAEGSIEPRLIGLAGAARRGQVDIRPERVGGTFWGRPQIRMEGESVDQSTGPKVSILSAGFPAIPTRFIVGTQVTTELAGPVEAANMRSFEVEDATNETITSTAYALQTNWVGINFLAPESGTVEIDLYHQFLITPSANVSRILFGSFEVATVGGIVHLAPSDNHCVLVGSNVAGTDGRIGASMSKLVTGLTPGDTYRVRTMARINTNSSITNAVDLHRKLLLRFCL